MSMYKQFNNDKFCKEVFCPKPNTRESKLGWHNWKDVRCYYGLGLRSVNERLLREGIISPQLKECLERTLGKEKLATYFPAPPAPPKKTRDQQEIDDLATLMCGTVRDVNSLKS